MCDICNIYAVQGIPVNCWRWNSCWQTWG